MTRFLWVFATVLGLLGCNGNTALHTTVVNKVTEEPVKIALFSHQGDTTLWLDSKEQVQLWSKASAALKTLPSDKITRPIRHLVLSADDTFLLYASNNELAIWRLPDDKLIATTQFYGQSPLARISALALSSDKKRLVVGMEDGTINMAELSTGVNHQFTPHSQKVTQLLIDQNGEKVLSGSLDGQFALWQFAEPKALFSKAYQHRITSLAVDKDFTRVFVSDGLDAQEVIRLADGEVLAKLNYMSRFKAFRLAEFVPNSQLLVTTAPKGQLSVWNSQTGEELGSGISQAEREGSSIIDLHFIDSATFETINSDGLIEAWDLQSLQRPRG